MLPPTSFNETNSDAPGPEALVKAGNQPTQKQPVRRTHTFWVDKKVIWWADIAQRTRIHTKQDSETQATPMKRSSSSFRLLTRMRKFNTMIALSKNGCMLGHSTPLMSILTLNQMQPTKQCVQSWVLEAVGRGTFGVRWHPSHASANQSYLRLPSLPFVMTHVPKCWKSGPWDPGSMNL